ncbi:glycosyltransferase family 2 protein [Gordonia sp. N1V]|uniref:glycosyltransferase n=1 Tax=Gordonia sp. N1V TaxID=3034163 RepID=UPI0023E2FFB9|nr:glycosyltransferase family 2 protein [Gordonia sp. N1V]MDF3284206.1 glycosyltransferase family 2 protein [Gordonia sp. N1V]
MTAVPPTSPPMSAEPRVAVIVPAYNEQRLITSTLRALDAQRFDTVLERQLLKGFRVIVIDNNSTDTTAEVVEKFIAEGTRRPFELITETQKGIGSAVDTGVRHAIDTGAVFVARTDSDSVPDPTWLHELLQPLLAGRRLVGGRLRARHDEPYSPVPYDLLGLLWRVGHLQQKWRTRHEPPYAQRTFGVVGPNCAFDTEVYLTAGGYPRLPLEQVSDDWELQQRVRKVAPKSAVALAPRAIVRTSQRRVRHLGIRGNSAWYAADHRGGRADLAESTGQAIDIR